MKESTRSLLLIDRDPPNLAQCIQLVDGALEAVEAAASDYFNTACVLELTDTLSADNGATMTWPIHIDLKTLSVIAATTQTPLALRGDTDCGKTALAERVLTGLFGTYGIDWCRVEINRGLSVDDLVDIDVEKLVGSTVTQAMFAAGWLSKPARLLDEINRAHPKLLNPLLHIVDGSGFNIRGDVPVPVGQPYQIGDEQKRYSFCIVTANPSDDGFAGVFEEDRALTRRIAISIDLDELPPTSRDTMSIWARRRAKTALPKAKSLTQDLIQIYEAMPRVLPFSALGELFAYYLSGMNNCIRTLSGKVQPQLKPAICDGCHLAKASAYCGRVGGLSQGLLITLKELARAIAAVRACIVLRQTCEMCSSPDRQMSQTATLRRILGVSVQGEELYSVFSTFYLQQLQVTGEDVRAAFVLLAPDHIWIDRDWLKQQADCESKPFHVVRRVVREAWRSLVSFLDEHKSLVDRLVGSATLSPSDHEELERLVTTKDAALLNVINALRQDDVALRYQRDNRLQDNIQAA